MRNVVERIFGVLKRRLKILRLAPGFAFLDQVKLVYALSAPHNFIDAHTREEERELGIDWEGVLQEDKAEEEDTDNASR
jgi:hypothetical protein